MTSILDEIRRLNQTYNQGRGFSVVRMILQYIDDGNIIDAKQVWETDGDKLYQCPDIAVLFNELFGK